MTPDEIKTIAALCDVLRAKGVRLFDGAGIKVEFAPEAPPVLKDAPSMAVDVCKCGHPDFAHVNGLCTNGCEVEKCLGDEAKQVQ